jgi:hypothetical protein
MVRGRNPFLAHGHGLEGLGYAAIPLLSVPLSLVCSSMGVEPSQLFLFAVAPACIAAVILMAEPMMRERKRRRCEQSLMDSIFDVGSKMISGSNYENATLDSLSEREGCAELAGTLSKEYLLCRSDTLSAIESSIGRVSREIAMAFRNILVCSYKDSEDAGRLAVTLGRQFQNRNSTMRALELKLKSTTDMMLATAMFFAPLVLGMSVAMLEPLSAISGFSTVEGTSEILDAYLIELCLLISVLMSSLGTGESVRSMVWRFSVMCPVSLLVFAISSSLSI